MQSGFLSRWSPARFSITKEKTDENNIRPAATYSMSEREKNYVYSGLQCLPIVAVHVYEKEVPIDCPSLHMSDNILIVEVVY